MSLRVANELLQKADEKLKAEDFEGAVEIARSLKTNNLAASVAKNIGKILIDAGTALKNVSYIYEGVGLLYKIDKVLPDKSSHKIDVTYGLGKGQLLLYKLKQEQSHRAQHLFNSDLIQARDFLLKSLNLPDVAIGKDPEIWVNLGESYQKIGRLLDALECYEKALKLNPKNSEAQGLKGMILSYYAMMVENQEQFYTEAYHNLIGAIEGNLDHESKEKFETASQQVYDLITDKKKIKKPSKKSVFKFKSSSKLDKSLQEFSGKNRLFLNMCNWCQKCDSCTSDSVTVKNFEKFSSNGSPVNLVSTQLNNVKQAYHSARLMLALSQFKELKLVNVEKGLNLLEPLDENMNDLSTQLLVNAYQSFYRVLNQVAYFLKWYLGVEAPNELSGYLSFWFKNYRKHIVRGEILKTRNLHLNALFDIRRDLDEGIYSHLPQLMDDLAYGTTRIIKNSEDPSENDITERELLNQTVQLAKLVRNIIVYLYNFVYIEELKKYNHAKTVVKVPTPEAISAIDNII